MWVHRQVLDIVGLRRSVKLVGWRSFAVRISYYTHPTTKNPYTHTPHTHVMHTHTYNNRWVTVTSRTRVFVSTPCMLNPPDWDPSRRPVTTTPSTYRSCRTSGRRLWHHIHASRSETNPKSPASRVANWIWHRRRWWSCVFGGIRFFSIVCSRAAAAAPVESW